MSYVNVWIHAVWATKDREPLITNDLRFKLYDHILNNARDRNIWIDTINGGIDHIHCLISMNAEQSISWIMQMIKGESSYWINKNKLTNLPFEWQDKYYASSISKSQLNAIRKYIKNQDNHHNKQLNK
jgi:putative transposase